MSDTPRTDDSEELMGGLWFVLSDLARDLERENTALRGALAESEAKRGFIEHPGTVRFVFPSSAMACNMLRSLVDGWQSDMTATARYDDLVWEARRLLDELDEPLTNQRSNAMTHPTVGLAVWYHDAAQPQQGPFAATVAYVHPTDLEAEKGTLRLVNLGVLDPDGTPLCAANVPFVPTDRDPPEDGAYCEVPQ